MELVNYSVFIGLEFNLTALTVLKFRRLFELQVYQLPDYRSGMSEILFLTCLGSPAPVHRQYHNRRRADLR